LIFPITENTPRFRGAFPKERKWNIGKYSYLTLLIVLLKPFPFLGKALDAAAPT
jgi:hypothetical protein